MAVSLLIFTDNLRLEDNPPLVEAASSGHAVIPAFIFDASGKYARPPGAASKWWLHHSLKSLDARLQAIGSRLILRHGSFDTELRRLIAETGTVRVYLQTRAGSGHQSLMQKLAVGAELHVCGGPTLFAPDRVRTGAGKPYTVFTPFWRACLALPEPRGPLAAPTRLPAPDRWPESDASLLASLLPKVRWDEGLAASWTPGEPGARRALATFLDQGLAGYADRRDRPDLAHGTSRLSPHLRFGEISPHTIWQATRHSVAAAPALAKSGDHFLRELGWREFSYHLLAAEPDLASKALRPAFAEFPWREAENQAADFRQWSKGLTGFPIVDAGMRQLWQTGWMHNRVRMITASFLTKDLLIHWRDGEQWFWDTLVDADPANNPASWQWTAGCGADAAPFFRIFNPVLQGEKFDPEGDYVRRYIPELAELPAAFIHKPWEAPADMLTRAGVRLGTTYPHPMVERSFSRQRALDAFELIKQA